MAASIKANQARYEKACHAMQSGVTTEMNHLVTPATEPKHLRAGVNSALVQSSALAGLLIKKGVITEAEWWAALADEMDAEVSRYEERLTEHFGSKITLG